ncbi:hypothetical protein LCGC14_2815410 [marine sediment metagenome]|uniref:Phage replisome organiser N-terminal domain-containing protein n=1 Tax=marine sediment metagenome TaxID=412755 RepID=A0A0F9B9W3_9ZZZZ
MTRGRKARTWIKVDCEGILRGSINYLLTLDGQAIWVKMIALSEVCGGRPGYIEDNNESGLPHEYIAQELHCKVELLDTVLEKMTQDGAVNVNGSGSIHLVNFHHYQFSEYDRQKPYREAKKKVSFEEYVEEIRPEYADLNFGNELKKFHLYWSEGARHLHRPKLAVKNWMDNARKFGKDKKPGSRELPTTQQMKDEYDQGG